MKRVELVVTVADASDFDISATASVGLNVPDHYSAGHACRDALRLLIDAAERGGGLAAAMGEDE